MDRFDVIVQSSGNLNLYIKRELPYRWCNGCGFEPRSGRTKYYRIGPTHLSWIFIVPAHRNNSPQIDMSPQSVTLSDSKPTSLCYFSKMLRA
jgi:hypothetical protein